MLLYYHLEVIGMSCGNNFCVKSWTRVHIYDPSKNHMVWERVQ
uniref:Uncharacterized protein n=1 Tax=Rhizophora mucronata TaxID=61149 RepID=A0A2P2N4Q8_RHIMU